MPAAWPTMWLTIVVHLLIAGVIAASSAIACQLFAIPIWVGGVLGLILYLIGLAGTWLGDRCD